MFYEDFKNTYFQTFFISNEQSNCPLIANIARIGKNLEEMNILENDNSAIISIGYGKRIIINGKYTDFKKINRENILEIVDYDPIKKLLLVIGSSKPQIETPVHWIVHHARNDVNVIIHIKNKKLSEKYHKIYPFIVNTEPFNAIDLSKEILKKSQKGKNIVLKNNGIILMDTNIKDVENTVLKICGGNK